MKGKLLTKMDGGTDATGEQVEGLARRHVAEWLKDKESKKIVYGEKKLINCVV